MTPVEIPVRRDENINERKNETKIHTTTNFIYFMRYFWKMLRHFTYDYWLSNVGNDAYLYLFFQRQILKLLVQITVISFSCSLVFNTVVSFSSWTDKFHNFLIKALLGNKEVVRSTPSWLQVILTVVISLLTFRTISILWLESKWVI